MSHTSDATDAATAFLAFRSHLALSIRAGSPSEREATPRNLIVMPGLWIICRADITSLIPEGVVISPSPHTEHGPLHVDEAGLVQALQAGDEQVFAAVMERYSGSLLRMALSYVPSRAVAEEVVQETWMGVLEGIDRFESRSSFKTWLFRILSNRAKTRGMREHRYEPFGVAASAGEPDEERSFEDSLFVTEGSGTGHWKEPPQAWEADTPERALLSKECREAIVQAIDGLPPAQRQVMTLRDLEGVSSEEVCNILEISETNQRVLLHRARTKVRRVLEPYVKREKA